MSNVAIKVQKREKDELKKNSSRRLRTEGFIPAVVYGLAQEPVEIKISKQDFKDVTKGRGLSNLILDIHIKTGGKDKIETTLIKEMQKDPVSLDLLHIDFIRIQMKTEVEATVPIHILGEQESVGVKLEGGVMQHGLRELHVLCLPGDIPDYVEYDISKLHIGSNVKVADIQIEGEIKILNNPEEVIVSVIQPTHLVVEEVEAEEEAEEAEPELISGKKAEGKEEPEGKEETKKEE